MDVLGAPGALGSARPRRDVRADGVVLLRWPDRETERVDLAAREIPRLLVVSASCPPPLGADPLEDWVREPVDPGELDARATTLARRARARARRPRIDETGVVRVGARSIELSGGQAAVARVLVARFGRVVPAEQIQRAHLGAGGSIHPKAVKAVIGRVRHRLAELGLTLANVRDRGYLLGPGSAVDGNGDRQV